MNWEPLAQPGQLARLARHIDGSDPASESIPDLDSLRTGSVSAWAFAEGAATHLRSPRGGVRGAHPTARPLAQWVAGRLDAEPSGPVLDPACGCGHLLLAAMERLGPRQPTDWHGWDIDEDQVAATRITLWLGAGRRGAVADYTNIRCLDALLESPSCSAARVIANPPFMSIRRLARECGPEYCTRVRSAVPHLRGSFDLFVAFLLRLQDWVAPDGSFALIVPAPYWSADYAADARRLLAPHLAEVHDLASRALFGAAVSPHVLVGSAQNSRRCAVNHTDIDAGSSTLLGSCDEAALAVGFPSLHRLPEHVPLGQVATVSAGTAGYSARRTASALIAAESAPEGALPFIVTRCIAPFRVRDGPVRFMGLDFDRARLPPQHLTAGKRRLFSAPKILVRGVARSLVSARDTVGFALGVGVYAIEPRKVAPEVILALLNSPAVSDWYRDRFRGRELSGGYFAVNCNHLRAIPVPTSLLAGGAHCDRVVQLVRDREDPQCDDTAKVSRAIESLVRNALNLGLSA